MKDRFDLENDINALYSSASDLQTVAEMMVDSSLIYNEDRTYTVLNGLAEILEAKIAKLEDTFCQVFELNQYHPSYPENMNVLYKAKKTLEDKDAV